jgi:hypothetical protein
MIPQRLCAVVAFRTLANADAGARQGFKGTELDFSSLLREA